MKDIDWGKVKITDEVMKYVITKYGNKNWMEDNLWSQILLNDIYNTFYKDESEEDEKTHLDDVNLDDHDDNLDALDFENRIKKLKKNFGRLLKANESKKAKEAELKAKDAMLVKVVQVSSDEDASSDECFSKDLILFNNVKYPLTDAEIRMFRERPTTSRAPTVSTSNAQAAFTSTPRGRKIAMTGYVLGLRAPDDPRALPPSTTRKRNSKK
uniref:Uncharacterized protein n=1 Tax=Tanacetum cinerariifolium TaxID=118510 RepID=A0A699HVK8_TANCI|nr:hypothetical protein [Tanacetum cinerariifolium]